VYSAEVAQLQTSNCGACAFYLISCRRHILYDVAIEGLAGRKQNSLDRVHTPLQQHAMVDCAKELSRLPLTFYITIVPVVTQIANKFRLKFPLL